jgi:exodeoxyribonuclease-3
MKLISFNINGIKSMTGKLKNGEKSGSATNNVIKSLIEEQHPDVLCFQELKSQSVGDIAWLKMHFPHLYTNFSKYKKGYSGVALLSKVQPEWVTDSFDEFDEEWIGEYKNREFHTEGRILAAKFPNCIIVTVYTPNAQQKLARLEERVQWEQVLRMYLIELEKKHEVPVVLCGDLNCAHQEIDIHNPKANVGSPGFSKEERAELQLMIDAGFTDSFRYLHPDLVKYSYFSNFAKCRERNLGWRIDYFLVSDAILDHIQEADVLNDYYGSDHCPVMLVIS